MVNKSKHDKNELLMLNMINQGEIAPNTFNWMNTISLFYPTQFATYGTFNVYIYTLLVSP